MRYLLAPGFGRSRLGRLTFLAKFVKQRRKILGVFLLHRENLFHQAARRRILVAKVVDHFPIRIDRDAFGDKIFPDHIDQVVTFHIIGMAA